MRVFSSKHGGGATKPKSSSKDRCKRRAIWLLYVCIALFIVQCFYVLYTIVQFDGNMCSKLNPWRRNSGRHGSQTGVVLLTHEYTKVYERRVHKWVKQTKITKTPFWILVDSTVSTTAFEAFAKSFKDVDRVTIVKQNYTGITSLYDHKMHEWFPNSLINPCKTMTWNTKPNLSLGQKIMWSHRPEGFNSWFQKCGDECRSLEYLWIIEMDIGYSGHFGDFLESYMTTTADLITSGIETISLIGFWPWQGCSSNWSLWFKFASLGRLKAHEGVQRMSVRYLHELHRFSLKEGTAHSEMFTPTVCDLISCCKMESMKPCEVVTPWNFEKCKDNVGHRFIHPCKTDVKQCEKATVSVEFWRQGKTSKRKGIVQEYLLGK